MGRRFESSRAYHFYNVCSASLVYPPFLLSERAAIMIHRRRRDDQREKGAKGSAGHYLARVAELADALDLGSSG